MSNRFERALASAVVLAPLTLGAMSGCAAADHSVARSDAELSARETAACVEPPLRDCNFYAGCLERDRPCGEDGYALGYGDRYCRRFLASNAFSARGIVWRDETMRCLQRRLGRYLGDASATCEAVKDGAFDDHPLCYTQAHASICELPWTDWLEVVATIDLVDLMSRRGRKQIAETARTCVGGWVTPPWMRAPRAGDGTREQAPELDVLGVSGPSERNAASELAAKLAFAEALEQDPDASLETLRTAALRPLRAD